MYSGLQKVRIWACHGTIYAGFPSSLGFEVGGQPYSNVLASTVRLLSGYASGSCPLATALHFAGMARARRKGGNQDGRLCLKGPFTHP